MLQPTSAGLPLLPFGSRGSLIVTGRTGSTKCTPAPPRGRLAGAPRPPRAAGSAGPGQGRPDRAAGFVQGPLLAPEVGIGRWPTANHIGHAILREDARGTRLATEHKDSPRRIDAAAAAVMAVHRAAELADRSPAIYA
jgi:hypothetical protein